MCSKCAFSAHIMCTMGVVVGIFPISKGEIVKNIFGFKTFARNEDGSLLVFFVISIVTILGIFALSFDMGRRASTQTDMQSFADNVALAAAGELDGSPGAIANARTAAANVINVANEQLKAGTGVAAAGLTITFDPQTDLVFYENLPARDTPASFDPAALEGTKYTLPGGGTTDPALAVYVGVTLNTVDVDWLFAEVVSNNVPDAAVGAVAIAGNAGYTCEIAPLMFCLPRENGASKTLVAGQAVRLETSGGPNTSWNPGQFGYLNVDDAITDNGPCAGLNPESRRQACLLARGLGACFQNRGVDIQTGQRAGQEIAGFNLPFGVFTSTMNGFTSEPAYATGPHTLSGQIHTGNGPNCSINQNQTDTAQANPVTATMAFPLDDCHDAGNCADGRFGDGDWSDGRDEYVEVNYTHYDTSGGGGNGNGNGGNGNGNGNNGGGGTTPPTVLRQGSWFDFPEPNLTRYQYYLREIERAANGGVMNAAGSGFYVGTQYENDNIPGNLSSWDDYWQDNPSGLNPIIPDALGKQDNGLPQCGAVNPSTNTDRRVVIVAGIDCPPGALQGNEEDVPVVQYYRTFLLQPARNSSGGGGGGSGGTPFEINVEIIEPVGGEGGGSTTVDTAFREVIQLYR